MPLYRINELLRFLETLGAKPKKGLSQNFLIDGNIVQKILQEADIQAGDSVLEIGSGPGVLTEALLNAGADVVAVEKDEIFAQSLLRFANLKVNALDIRDFPLDTLKKKSKVVSNLPYHLTTPILSLLVKRFDLFTSITVMVQEEVARRMTAKPKTSDFSSLTIFLSFYTETHYAFHVSKNCFYPKPKVDSAVVTLKLKEPPLVNEERFFFLVRTAFQQRRKMLKSCLRKHFGAKTVEEALEKIGQSKSARPEEMPLEAFLDLYRILDTPIIE